MLTPERAQDLADEVKTIVEVYFTSRHRQTNTIEPGGLIKIAELTELLTAGVAAITWRHQAHVGIHTTQTKG